MAARGTLAINSRQLQMKNLPADNLFHSHKSFKHPAARPDRVAVCIMTDRVKKERARQKVNAGERIKPLVAVGSITKKVLECQRQTSDRLQPGIPHLTNTVQYDRFDSASLNPSPAMKRWRLIKEALR
ncbi:hypothetical protein F2P81_013106 [Scophthalmus maximus]|uniref:Uncharacterized protein n=1 Tax=Scophthalmus maximus TaxID=52904 RepID=A0A6A4ST57_SCOMX|nr:hypothetical protein F2P81_013106 [Scophthalmus maximus]